MPTAADLTGLVQFFSPYISAADTAKLGQVVAALDWNTRQQLPQRRFGLRPRSEATERLQQQIAALQPPPPLLQREVLEALPGLLWCRFATAEGFAGFLAVRRSGGEFQWSATGKRKLCWSDNHGHGLAWAAATVTDTAGAYTTLLGWVAAHLTTARCDGLPVPEAEQQAVTAAIEGHCRACQR